MQILKKTNIDFIGRSRISAVLSSILILAGIVSIIAHGGLHQSTDFTGGSTMMVEILDPPDIADLRQVLETKGFEGAEVKTVHDAGKLKFSITTKDAESDEEGGNASDRIQALLNAEYPDRVPGDGISTSSVSSKVGKEMKLAAVNSIMAALVLIVLYITVRFVFRFGIAAIVALVHDVVITLGVFSILDKEISLTIIAAFLTIIGYSLNDTIVVFDRIRENMSLRRKESYGEVVNRSINETLSRTIVTSLTTLFVAVSLYVFGGAVIHDFAFALCFGVLIGTYSSIFVASPVLVWWYRRNITDTKRRRQTM